MNYDTDHVRFRDDIGAYLAGGLTDAERRAFASHASACRDCAAALAGAAAQEQHLNELFASARPGDDFEDRLVSTLRARAQSGPAWRRLRIGFHPAVRRAAVGVAAAVMLAGFGYVATETISGGGLPAPWAIGERVRAASNLRQIGQGVQMSAHENKGEWARSYDSEFDDEGASDFVPLGETPTEMAKKFNERARTSWGESTGATAAPGNRTLLEKEMRDGAAMPGMFPGMMAPPTAEARQRSEKRGELQAGRPFEGRVSVLRDLDRSSNGRSAQPADVKQQMAGENLARGFRSPLRGQAQGGQNAQPAPGTSFDTRWSFVQPSDAPKAGGAVAAGVELNGPAPLAAPGPAPMETLYKKAAGAPADRQAGAAERQLALGYSTFKPANAAAWGVQAPQDTSGYILDSTARQEAGAAEPAQARALGVQVPQAEQPGSADAPGDGGIVVRSKGDSAAQEVEAAIAQVQPGESAAQSDPTSGQAPATNAAPAVPVAQVPPQPQPHPATAATAGRKIIRNGQMSFEVDSFDSAYMQITKIAGEEGGFVATTDSEKLANGKVRGVVTVRVPPDRLDTLVLKLRGLGELKSSKIAAQDITKQYTDLESQLKAARAMEERLLNVIKTGKGEIKDLVEAEKQLGIYRERIEQIEGEVRYFNNLVSLSTLNVTLTERDIRTASLLSETEQVNMGVEAEDVEKARAATIKAIEEAKGRIVESDLKKLEAGQFAGRVVADVPPDASGPLIDRLRQVGVVARLEIARKQTTPEGTVAPGQGAALPRVERRDTRFLISLYNLANVAPRQTTTMNLAAEDVEVAYRAILDQVKSAGGRVVTSQLNRPKPDQTTGTITFEVPSEQADVLLGAVRANGEVMRLDVTQNPDTQNVTQTKRGFAVQIFSTAAVAPRETTSLRVAARGVADAFNKLREVVRTAKGGRILSSQLAEADAANVTGTLDFEVRRDDWATIETAVREAGQVVSRNVSRSSDAENTVDTKIRLQVSIVDEAALAPRETVAIQLAVRDVSAEYAKLLEALGAAQARILQSQLNEQETRSNVTANLTFDVSRSTRPAIDRALAEAGDTVSRNVVRSTDTQNTLDDKVRLSLTITDADRLAPRETTTLGMESADVEKSKEAIESLALGMGGRIVDSTLSREANGRVMAKVVADVPLNKAMEMVSRTRDQGKVQFRRDARDENIPAGPLSRYRVDVTLANEDLIVESGQGLGSRIREGLRTSAAGLLWSVQLIVVGLFLVAPWALIIWLVWRVVRRGRTKHPGTATTMPAAS